MSQSSARPDLPRIAVIGCGGLGVPAAWTLCLGGVRRLRLIDPDCVELSNLHRQVAFRTAEVGAPKTTALAGFLQRSFAGVDVEVRPVAFADATATALLDGCGAALEGSDDAGAKFLANDHCVALGLPVIIAAAIGRRGQWFGALPAGPCYRCLFEAPPAAADLATCAVAGVLGPVVGQVGSLAARSLLRHLLQRPDAAHGALVRLENRGLLRTVPARAADCPACGMSPLPSALHSR